MRHWMAITAATGAALSAVAAASPASAACSVRTVDGYPRWSASCSQTVAPGRFGPLTMGRTTVKEAKRLNYLARNPACGGRLDGLGAGPDWRRRDGRVVAWWTRATTTKGLTPTSGLAAAERLYPGMRRTGYVENPYVNGAGWTIYSWRGGKGWLDMYIHRGDRTLDARNSFFVVRAGQVARPYTSWAFDGC